MNERFEQSLAFPIVTPSLTGRRSSVPCRNGRCLSPLARKVFLVSKIPKIQATIVIY